MIITRRVASKRDDGDRAADSLENGASLASSSSNGADKDAHNMHYISGSASKSFSSRIVRQFDDGKHIVISMAAVNRYLKNMIIWGSLLYVGYQFGLSGGCMMERQQSQQLPSEQPQLSLRKYDSNKPPTLKQIYEARNCESYLAQIDEDGERIDSKSLPIYTDEQWHQFRNLWKEQGGKNAEEYYKKSDKRRSKAPPDFIPPVKAGQTKDGKGRGIFAARDIKKGEMTYGLSKNYIFFKSGNEFRRFLDALDDEKACDLMKFTWPQEGIGPKGEPLIWGPMDYAALMNHGEPGEVNTGCPRHVYCGNFDEYALRDIKEGEELLCDYGEFFDLNFLEFKKWKWFGL